MSWPVLHHSSNMWEKQLTRLPVLVTSYRVAFIHKRDERPFPLLQLSILLQPLLCVKLHQAVHLELATVDIHLYERVVGQREDVVVEVSFPILIELVPALQKRLRNALTIEQAHQRQQPSSTWYDSPDVFERDSPSGDN